MSRRQGLETLLDECRRWQRRVGLFWSGAAALWTALVLTLLFTAVIVAVVPDGAMVVLMRVVLYGAVAGILLFGLWYRPGRKVVARALEKRVPALDGRLLTWVDATTPSQAAAQTVVQRGEQPDARGSSRDAQRNAQTRVQDADRDGPILSLLAGETLTIASDAGAGRLRPWQQRALPGVLAATALLSLAVLFTAGPLGWQLGAQRLWLGWMLADYQPRLVVEPGSITIPRDGDITLRARAEGFAGAPMQLQAALAGGGWERVPMQRLSDDVYEFTFAGVRDGLDYYVTSGQIASERYRIDVVDVPVVRAMRVIHEHPEWTRLPPETRRSGDVVALAGSRITVEVDTDPALHGGLLIVDDRAAPLAIDGATGTGAFGVEQDGRWYLAVDYQGREVRLTDEYLIRVVDNEPPEVAFVWPGRDRSATAIEEVPVRFEASDRYHVASVSVHWAVNGGPWSSREFAGGAAEVAAEHLFDLEQLRAPEGPQGERALRPGDLISFYASARDNEHEVRTTLYFVDVRPFDRYYREVSGGGGGGGGDGLDIAQRQREIVSATWNLLRESQQGRRAADAIADQTELLAGLQRTLSEQAQTLIDRARSRGLDADGSTGAFIEHMRLARDAMDPAIDHLVDGELEAALPPEQDALRHLLAGEASIRDVNLSLSNDGDGGSGRSLSELIELEMDPERNRYETAQSPSGQDAGGEDDETWRELEALAERQQQLADAARDSDDLLASRWQQERLQREIEEMQRRLQAAQQARSQGAAEGGQPGAHAEGGDVSGLERALERLDEAARLGRGEDEGSESTADAAAAAAEALREAARGLQDERRASLDGELQALRDGADRLTGAQRELAARLEMVQRRALDAARDGAPLQDGLDGEQRWELARGKRDMRQDLTQLEGDISRLSGAPGTPEAVRGALSEALQELGQARVGERLLGAEDAVLRGRGLFIASSESVVTEALEQLQERLGGAQQLLASTGLDGPEAGDARDTALREVQQLRRQLRDVVEDPDAPDGRAMQALRDVADRGAELAAGLEPGLLEDPDEYRIRGLGTGNRERLAQMTLSQLDRLELALRDADSAAVRGGSDHAVARDDAAARYFRSLSCGSDGCPDR